MELEIKKIPKHMGIIIDGNGRWAKAKGLTRSMGHKFGFDNLIKIIKECFYVYKIPYLSIYCFSTENWNRPKKEVDFLCKIFRGFVDKDFLKNFPNVKLNVMGDYKKFPKDVADNAEKTMEKTKNNTEFVLNLGINYSGQDELVYAMNNIVKEGIKNIDRKVIEDHLYTKGQPLLDFLIRTSGEHRLSNFMLWQVSYAELYFPKVYWPAFSKNDLKEALIEFQNRDRRFGAIKEE